VRSIILFLFTLSEHVPPYGGPARGDLSFQLALAQKGQYVTTGSWGVV